MNTSDEERDGRLWNKNRKELHNAAILTGRQVQNAAYRGNSIQGQFRTTLVFVQQQRQWRLASLQLSSLAENA